MLNSLDLLIIVFGVMCVVSILAVLIMFLIKDERKKKGIFYFLVIWGLYITSWNVRTLTLSMTNEYIIAFGIGALSLVALLINLLGKSAKAFKIAQILAAVSVVAGMIDTFAI